MQPLLDHTDSFSGFSDLKYLRLDEVDLSPVLPISPLLFNLTVLHIIYDDEDQDWREPEDWREPLAGQPLAMLCQPSVKHLFLDSIQPEFYLALLPVAPQLRTLRVAGDPGAPRFDEQDTFLRACASLQHLESPISVVILGCIPVALKSYACTDARMGTLMRPLIQLIESDVNVNLSQLETLRMHSRPTPARVNYYLNYRLTDGVNDRHTHADPKDWEEFEGLCKAKGIVLSFARSY